MKVKIKRSGSIFIGVTVFLGVAAANTGNNLLYILVSALLSVMLVSGVASLLNLKGIRVVLIPPPRVFAGRRTTFRLILRKKGILPSFLIKVSSSEDSCLFVLVDRRRREGKLEITFGRRGKVDKVSLVVSSDFPLGMFVRSYTLDVGVDLVVFPSPLPWDISAENPNKSPSGDGRAGKEGAKGYDEVRDIRAYLGEPMKLIHWRISAKVGSLMVRNMVSETNPPVVLSLEDVEGSLEERISKLTYGAMKLIEAGYPVGLKIGNREIPPGTGEDHLNRILRELALY